MILGGFAANNIDLYLSEIRRMFIVVMFCTIVYLFSLKDPNFSSLFYILYSIKFLFFFYYAYDNGLLTTQVDIKRFNLEELNSNAFGYFAFFAITGSFILLLLTSRPFYKFLNLLVLIMVMIMSFISVYLSASRAGLIFVSASIIIYYLIYFVFPFTRKSIPYFVLILCTLVLLQPHIQKALENSLITKRFEIAKGDHRIDLLKMGMEVGLDHPIFGVGSGNFNIYTKEGAHSSFAGILANNGIPGLMLYIYLIYEALKKAYINLKSNKFVSRVRLVFFIFFILFALYNFFYWFHLNLFLLGFFFIIRAHLENINKVTKNVTRFNFKTFSTFQKNQLAK